MTPDDQTPLVIYGDRWKAGRIVLMSLALVLGGLFMMSSGKDRPTGVGVVLFFGATGLFSLVGVVRPPRLTLDAEGFRVQGLRSWRVAWTDVERFRLMTLRRASTVLIDYRAQSAPTVRVRRERRPRALPRTLERSPEAVLALLQEGLARARAASPDQHPAMDSAEIVAEPTRVVPWVSLGITVVLCLAFAAEILLPVQPPPHALQPAVATLAAFGGLSRQLVLVQGQWFRLVTAPFLHGSLPHLLLNGFALLLAGRLLEGVVGRTRFAAIYVVGALAGGAGSMLLNQPTTISVGASGAILALFAATYVCSFHFAPSTGRYRLQSNAVGILVPTLLTLGGTGGGQTVDFGAHLGGAIGGALAGLLLLRSWSPGNILPGCRKLARAIAVCGALAVAAAVWPAVATNSAFQRLTLLIPPEAMPADDAAFVAQAPSLLAAYPNDPRVHLAMALHLLEENHANAAEMEGRSGLAVDPVVLHQLVAPRTEASLYLIIGEALTLQQKDHPALAAYDQALAIDGTYAEAYYRRGLLRFSQGSFDAALPDATQVTQRAPDSPRGWDLQGDLLFARGDPVGAVAAYTAAALRDATELPLRARGLAEFYANDRAAAARDLQKAAAIAPGDLYAALWLDFAEERQGLAPTLSDATLQTGGQGWPAPVVRLFTGALSASELAASPKTFDETCEADFYTGEWHRIHDRPADAEAAFRKAVTECTPTMVEAWTTRAELQSLQPGQ